MALYITLNSKYENQNVDSLIRQMIDEGKIDTWRYDIDGDYVYNPIQWTGKAWIRLKGMTKDGKIAYGIVSRQGKFLSKSEYAIYFGRFAEMILSHFDNYIQQIEISSLIIPPIDECFSEDE